MSFFVALILLLPEPLPIIGYRVYSVGYGVCNSIFPLIFCVKETLSASCEILFNIS